MVVSGYQAGLGAPKALTAERSTPVVVKSSKGSSPAAPSTPAQPAAKVGTKPEATVVAIVPVQTSAQADKGPGKATTSTSSSSAAPKASSTPIALVTPETAPGPSALTSKYAAILTKGAAASAKSPGAILETTSKLDLVSAPLTPAADVVVVSDVVATPAGEPPVVIVAPSTPPLVAPPIVDVGPAWTPPVVQQLVPEPRPRPVHLQEKLDQAHPAPPEPAPEGMSTGKKVLVVAGVVGVGAAAVAIVRHVLKRRRRRR